MSSGDASEYSLGSGACAVSAYDSADVSGYSDGACGSEDAVVYANVAGISVDDAAGEA